LATNSLVRSHSLLVASCNESEVVVPHAHKRSDDYLRCGIHSLPPSDPFSIVLLKRTSAAVAMASFS
jgi:hypothetical protein